MLRRISDVFVKVAERWMPDPLVIAIFLTAVSFAAALMFTDFSAVQGPIVTEAALQLGADIPRVAMSVTVGEVWTNMIQPLYAVPVLAIAGLHIRDIMGYCVIALLTLAPIYLTAPIFF